MEILWILVLCGMTGGAVAGMLYLLWLECQQRGRCGGTAEEQTASG